MLALKHGIVFSHSSDARVPLDESVSQIIAQTLTRCQQELGASTGVVFIRREDSVELLGARGYTPQVVAAFAALPLTAHFPLTDCVAEDQAIWLRSTSEWEHRYPVSIANAKGERSAWCAIPLHAEGHVVAALGLGWAQEQAFDERFQLHATALADECAAALRELTADQVCHTRLPSGGKLASMIRAHDWTATPLGPKWMWPAALRSTLSMMLSSARPMLLWWGPELVQLHNDAYSPLLAAAKTPSLLGRKARDCWEESGSTLEPLIASVYAGHEVCRSTGPILTAEQDGLRECYFDCSYSPVYREHGEVAGVLVTYTETTARVVSERRLSALEQLSGELTQVDTLDAFQAAWSRALSRAQSDLPCVLLYLSRHDDDSELRLRGSLGVEGKQHAAPQRVQLDDASSSIARMMVQAQQAEGAHTWSDVDMSGRAFTAALSSDSMHRASAVALRSSSQDRAILGYLITELNPHLAPDQPYLQFIRLVAAHLACTLARLPLTDGELANVAQPSGVRSGDIEQLATRAQWLEQAPRIAGVGLFVLDVTSGRIDTSPELRELLGAHMREGRQTLSAWSATVFDEDIRRVSSVITRALAVRKSHLDLELRLNTSELTPRWVRATADIAYGSDGSPLRVFGGMIDIQVLKDAVLARDAALLQVKKLSQSRDDFFATLSHELRTPLHAVLGWASLLRESPFEPDYIAQGLSTIERNAQSLARLVDDVLDMSRIVSGKLRIVPRPFPLGTALQAAVEVLRPAADAKGIQLRVRVTADLGDIVADPDRLQQILWNLLNNAVRFTPRLGTITLSAERGADNLKIVVIDTGQGIASSELPRIFDRYRQADSSTTRAYQGLGLGLAIVDDLVTAHGGTVTAHSDGLGLGARFTVTLPLPPSTAAKPVVAEAQRRKVAGGLENVRVLVVDDDADARKVIAAMLTRAGALVSAQPSAEAALNDSGHYDVIISDIGMPDVDGYQLIKRLRQMERHRNVAAIALTGFATERDELAAHAAGFQAHMLKPVSFAQLIDTIIKLAGLRR